MGRFTVIPQDTFEGIQVEAGVILRTFNPSNPTAPADADIVCATTGGITVSMVPTYSDMGEDVDNCPNNMKELKHLDSWEAKMSFTSIGTSPASIKLALGAADIDSDNASHIIPRAELLQTDFADLWWVGDRADGGLVACKLKNALATTGFSLKTTKKGKGNVSVELTGHVSINEQEDMPMEFYSMEPSGDALFIKLDKGSAVMTVGDEITLKATATDGATVVFDSTDETVATVGSSTGEVEAVGAGVCVVTAKATKSGQSEIVTCIITVEAAS